jgi:transcriptional regulator with XRE-family HTH domain
LIRDEQYLGLLGTALAKYRWASHVSYADLCKRLNLSTIELESIERGESDLDVLTFWNLAEEVGLHAADLLGEVEQVLDMQRALPFMRLCLSAKERHYMWLGKLVKAQELTNWRLQKLNLARQRASMSREKIRAERLERMAAMRKCSVFFF